MRAEHSRALRSPKDTNELSLQVAESLEAIEGVREAWSALQRQQSNPDPNADPDHFITVIRYLGEGQKPCVVLITDAHGPAALVAGRTGWFEAELKFGYRTLFRTGARALTVVRSGILIRPGFEEAERIVGVMRQIVRGRSLDLLFLHMISTDSPVHRSVLRARYSLIRALRSPMQRHWMMAVPASFEEFLRSRSRKHRANLNSYSRRLEREFPDWTVRSYRRTDEVDDLLSAAETVAEKSYQRGLGFGFSRDPLTAARFSKAAQQGWLRSYVLYLDHQPCAFQLAFDYRNTLFGQGKAYDPRYASYRAGTFLFLKILEDLSSEGRVQNWDFGIGDAEYKQTYGTSFWTEEDVFLCAGTVKGMLAALLLMLNHRATRAARALLAGFEAARSAKKSWRVHAAKETRP